MRTKIASMKYLLCFIAAVMMFGSSGIVASTLPLSAFEVCLMRLIIGALSMGLIFVVTRQRLPRHVGRRQYLFVALSGACLGLAMMTIFAAYRLLGVGLGAVLAATAPVITMALSPLLFKERLRIPVMVGFAIVVGGLLLLNASALEGALSVPGILMGLAAAASTASSPSPIARPFFGMAFSPVCWNTVSIPQPPADFRPFLSDYSCLWAVLTRRSAASTANTLRSRVRNIFPANGMYFIKISISLYEHRVSVLTIPDFSGEVHGRLLETPMVTKLLWRILPQPLQIL